jgi:hypothetical protein
MRDIVLYYLITADALPQLGHTIRCFSDSIYQGDSWRCIGLGAFSPQIGDIHLRTYTDVGEIHPAVDLKVFPARPALLIDDAHDFFLHLKVDKILS